MGHTGIRETIKSLMSDVLRSTDVIQDCKRRKLILVGGIGERPMGERMFKL